MQDMPEAENGAAMITAVVVGNGRGEMLDQTIESMQRFLPGVAACILVDDFGNADYQRYLRDKYPNFQHVHHAENKGMAVAVQSAWTAALMLPTSFLWHNEEDMLLTRPVPLLSAVAALDAHPNLAQICFRRAPWWGSEPEVRLGDQLAAICEQATIVDKHDDYTTHDFIFSLNPCVIPRRVLEFGWPAGPLGIGNETGFTNLLLDQGFVFGSWGHPHDGQVWAEHVGHQRGAGWKL